MMNDNGGSSDAGSVGERLMTALFRKKMSMRELSRKTGLCQPSISKWCRGKAEPKLEYSRKMSEVLEVSVDWLAFGLPKPSDHEGVARSGIIRPETDFSLAFSEGTAINLWHFVKSRAYVYYFGGRVPRPRIALAAGHPRPWNMGGQARNCGANCSASRSSRNLMEPLNFSPLLTRHATVPGRR